MSEETTTPEDLPPRLLLYARAAEDGRNESMALLLRNAADRIVYLEGELVKLTRECEQLATVADPHWGSYMTAQRLMRELDEARKEAVRHKWSRFPAPESEGKP